MKLSGYVSGTFVVLSCQFHDDWPNCCGVRSKKTSTKTVRFQPRLEPLKAILKIHISVKAISSKSAISYSRLLLCCIVFAIPDHLHPGLEKIFLRFWRILEDTLILSLLYDSWATGELVWHSVFYRLPFQSQRHGNCSRFVFSAHSTAWFCQ